MVYEFGIDHLELILYAYVLNSNACTKLGQKMGWGSCGLFVMKVVSSSFSLYNNKQTKREKTRKNSVIGGHKIQECTFPTVMYVFFFFP